MKTTDYYMIAVLFIGSIYSLIWLARRIVQKICYLERKRIHKDLSFSEWLDEVWNKEN